MNMPSEFTTFRRHVLSPPGRNSRRGRWDAMHVTVVQANPQFGVIVDGELDADVNLIRREVSDCGGKRHETKSADPCSGVETPVWS